MAKKSQIDKAFFDSLSERIVKNCKEVLLRGANLIVEDAKSRCPVQTGNLRDSIHIQTTQNSNKVKIVADAKADDGEYYGKVVEFSPKINKPYLYPAFDAHADSIKAEMGEAIKKGLE